MKNWHWGSFVVGVVVAGAIAVLVVLFTANDFLNKVWAGLRG